MSHDVELARKWPSAEVADCLDRRDKDELVRFVKERHEQRFFGPIRALRPFNKSGFAITALCSLLVETIQSYRLGLPSTHRGELQQFVKEAAMAQWQVPVPEWPRRGRGEEIFVGFFSDFRSLFPSVDGVEYYKCIRNGLLHQAQTKGGWLIKTGQQTLWDAATKTLDRNRLADGLKGAFDEYLGQLESTDWNSDAWRKAERKIRWLVHLSR